MRQGGPEYINFRFWTLYTYTVIKTFVAGLSRQDREKKNPVPTVKASVAEIKSSKVHSFRLADGSKILDVDLSRPIRPGESVIDLFNLVRQFNPFGRPIGGLDQPQVEVVIVRHHPSCGDREPFRQRVGTAQAENISNLARSRMLRVRSLMLSTVLLIVVVIGPVLLGSVFTE